MKNKNSNPIPTEIILKALHLSSNNIIITDVDANILWVNKRTCDFTGYSFKEFIGQNPKMLKSEENNPEIFTEMWKTIKINKKPWQGKIKNNKKDGTKYTEFLTITPILNKLGDIEYFIGIQTDITEIEELKEKIKSAINDIHKEIKSKIMGN